MHRYRQERTAAEKTNATDERLLALQEEIELWRELVEMLSREMFEVVKRMALAMASSQLSQVLHRGLTDFPSHFSPLPSSGSGEDKPSIRKLLTVPAHGSGGQRKEVSHFGGAQKPALLRSLL